MSDPDKKRTFKRSRIAALWRAEKNDHGLELTGRVDVAMSAILLKDGDNLAVELSGETKGPDAWLVVSKEIKK